MMEILPFVCQLNCCHFEVKNNFYYFKSNTLYIPQLIDKFREKERERENCWIQNIIKMVKVVRAVCSSEFMSDAGGINKKPSTVIIKNFVDQKIVIRKRGRNLKQMKRVYVDHLTAANIHPLLLRTEACY